MAGRYGNETVSIINLPILDIDAANNLVLVKGAVPGRKKGIVRIKTTTRKNKQVKKAFNMFVRVKPTQQEVVNQLEPTEGN